jgi:hypothetical protein
LKATVDAGETLWNDAVAAHPASRSSTPEVKAKLQAATAAGIEILMVFLLMELIQQLWNLELVSG